MICSISLDQALGIWSDLWQAYYGENGYGGDTAEIYAYRLIGRSPLLTVSNDEELLREIGWEAYKNLQSFLTKFHQEVDCEIKVDDIPLHKWYEPLIHRCHVQILRK